MSGPHEPNRFGVERLAAIDEILQVMYWMRGEQLASAVEAADLSRWIDLAAEEIASLLEDMASSGLVRAGDLDGDGASPKYVLTDIGAREGGRRFADEFADLTRPGHFECADPNCECQRSGNPADCEHRQHSH